MWSSRSSSSMTISKATEYCSDLSAGGYNDWSMPTISELRTLIENCPATETGGSCGITDSCRTSNCEDSTCSGCFSESNHSKLRDNGLLLSQTNVNNSFSLFSYFGVDFSTGSIEKMEAGGVFASESAPIRCVRTLCDADKFWNGNECIINPCMGIEHSTGVHFAVNSSMYSCNCENGYTWNGYQCKQQTINLNVGNICTGQNSCYSETSEMVCPTVGEDFFGQDMQYSESGSCTQQSFSIDSRIENEPIVVDNNTGLEWQQIITTDKYIWNDAWAYCGQLNYGGNNDWRLPNPQELLTIVDNSKSYPPLNTAYFQNIDVALWSSESCKNCNSIESALFVSNTGELHFSVKTSSFNVICVRGTELATGSFVSSTAENGDIVVTDSTTGLIWQKIYETTKNWQQALSYCENLTYAGYSDWRLPNKNELASLINFDKNQPASSFPDMPYSVTFWSSSTARNTSGALAISFANGIIGYANKTANFNVLCVRSDICGNGYLWNGSQCIVQENPCEYQNPCNFIEHSNKICTAISATEYSCGCENNYSWDGTECVSNWSAASTDTMNHSNAISYCEDLSDGGYTWRLPTINELRTLIQNCSATQTGGTCGVTDTCLESSCKNDDCGGCSGSESYSKFGDTGKFWSSSQSTGGIFSYWGVDFDIGSIEKGALLVGDFSFARVRCVRSE